MSDTGRSKVGHATAAVWDVPAIGPASGGAWDALGRSRIALTYGWRHRRLPDLARPTLFTELVQDRKLNHRDLMMARMADKVAVKAIVADRIGRDWIIPTLWHGESLPPRPIWDPSFVVKSRHGCNQSAFVRTGGEDWEAIRRRARRWMMRPYGVWLDEWLYRHIPRGVLVEPFVGVGGALPVDYKFYVFGGRAAYVQVHIERERRHRWMLFDRDWRRVSAVTMDDDPPPPVALPAMLAAAEALATGFDFARVDLYEVAGRPLFGEMTFYPGSGLDPFDPPALDGLLGRHWLDARRR